MVAVRESSCLVNSCKIIHLGKNPERGGRPPRESRANGKDAVKRGDLAQEVARVLIVVVLLVLRVRNAADVISRYSTRAVKVRDG